MTARTLARAGLIVSAAFLVSRVLGWLRLVVIADAVPNPAELDAFFAAFRIPDLLFQLVAAGALSSALIPIVADVLETDGEQLAWRIVSTVTNLMLSALLVLALFVLVFADRLVPIYTSGFAPSTMARTHSRWASRNASSASASAVPSAVVMSRLCSASPTLS